MSLQFSRDELNEWGKETFTIVRRLFQKSTSIDVIKESVKNIDPKTGREKVITKDDLTNLKIDLGKIKNVDDFLKSM